jgi:hypothetical protein
MTPEQIALASKWLMHHGDAKATLAKYRSLLESGVIRYLTITLNGQTGAVSSFNIARDDAEEVIDEIEQVLKARVKLYADELAALGVKDVE